MIDHTSRAVAWLLILAVVGSALLTPAAPAQAQAAPTPLAADNVEEWSAGAGLLYWANNCYADEFNPFAILKRRPAGGGGERTLESINDYARCITFRAQLSSADGLYYLDESESRIERMPLAEPYTPAVVKALTAAQFPLRSFVEADGYLYWVPASNAILRTRKDGSGPVETVATTTTQPTDAIMVGATLYWADRSGIWSTSVSCASLPCPVSQFSNLGGNVVPYGLLYQPVTGGVGGSSYRIYWVEQASSGANSSYTIRFRTCNPLTVCFVLPPQGQLPDPPSAFYSSTLNWRIGNLLLANNNIYWTEADFSTPINSNGDVKRRAYNASAPGADTIATGQAKIDSRIAASGDALIFARRNTGVYSLPLNAAAILRDFSVAGIEVTQGIQNLANSAPLAAGKTTYVRAYARQLSGPSTPNVEARLVGLRNGTPLPGSPLQPINGVRALTTGAGFDRARLNDGWYFLLPPSWITAGAISLRVEVDGRQIHADPNRADNQLTQAVSFRDLPPVCVWTVPVRTHTPLPSIDDPNFFAMVDQFKRRWPVRDVWIFEDTEPVEELQVCFYGPFPYPCYGPYELEDGWGLTNGIPDRDKVIVSLWGRALLSFNPDACDDIGAPVHFMGLVHPDANNGGAAGYASTISNQSWVQLPDHSPSPVSPRWDSIREGCTMAQELAHNYGRKHVNCGNPEDIDRSYPYPPCQLANVGPESYYGFDVATLTPIRPNETADFMSYNRRSWVSDYTWRALVAKLSSSGLAEAPPPAAEGDSVFVTGLVDADGQRGAIGSLLVLPAASVPPATRVTLASQADPAHDDGTAATDYTLRLLDAGGATLAERALALRPMDDHSADGFSALFSDLFPQPAGQVARVQLLANGTVVDEVRPGAAAPVAAVQQPAAGAQIGDTLTIGWTASDADRDDRLRFTVQYSHDAGASWHTLAMDVPGTPDPSNTLTYTDLGSLQGSAPGAARVRVLASDGYNTTIATSGAFTLANRRPEPFIIAPGAGQTYPAGAAVPLSGGARDAEEGGLSGAALSWQVDGLAQGAGADLSVAGLAPGDHTAALAASDTNAQTATETVGFRVAPLDVPLGAAPALDGSCADGAYGAGRSLGLRPYSDGSQARVTLLRSADHLWACFSGLRQGAEAPGAFAGLRVDGNHSREAQAQSGDAGFFVGEDGAVFTRAGDGAGGLSAAGPGGLAAQVSAGGGSWSAELRVDRAQLGGWDHLAGLVVEHSAVAAAGDDYRWPYAATASAPRGWASTALGSQPVVEAIEPFAATAGDAPFTLTVRGSGFVSGTTVLWGGAALATTFVDETQLTAQVSAAQLSAAATVPVTTRSPAPGSFVSNAAAFVVAAPLPSVSALTPARVFVRAGSFTLTVIGAGFAADAQVLWDGAPLATQYVSPTQLRAQVPAALVIDGQTAGVAVRNPTPAALISAALPFTVQALPNQLNLPMIRR